MAIQLVRRPDSTRTSMPASRRRRSPARLLVLRIAVLVLFVALWWAADGLGLIAPILAKSPGEVWNAFVDSVDKGVLIPALGATVAATLAGFILASIVGIIVGAALALLPTVSAVLDPFLDALNAMPRVALAPVFILYFGIGMSAKVALAFSIVVFVLIFSTRAGIRSADPEILRLSTMLDANKFQTFWKVLLPVSVPSIFSGLRLGLVYSLLGVVTSEIIASEEGVGTLIVKSAGAFQMEGVYAYLILLAIAAALLNTAMAMLEKYILRWQPPAAA